MLSTCSASGASLTTKYSEPLPLPLPPPPLPLLPLPLPPLPLPLLPLPLPLPLPLLDSVGLLPLQLEYWASFELGYPENDSDREAGAKSHEPLEESERLIDQLDDHELLVDDQLDEDHELLDDDQSSSTWTSIVQFRQWDRFITHCR